MYSRTIHSTRCFSGHINFFPWIEPSFTKSTYTSFPETSRRRVCWRSCHCFVSIQSAGLLPHCMLNHAVDTLLVSQSHYRLQYAMVGFYSYQADLACNSFFWKNVCSQVRCGSLAGTPSKELGKFLFHILKLQFNPFSYFHVF